jgi:hypothetical protein
VSLLPDPPPSSQSSTVLGWLPAETPGDDRDAGLNDFVENRARSFLFFYFSFPPPYFPFLASLEVSRIGETTADSYHW